MQLQENIWIILNNTKWIKIIKINRVCASTQALPGIDGWLHQLSSTMRFKNRKLLHFVDVIAAYILNNTNIMFNEFVIWDCIRNVCETVTVAPSTHIFHNTALIAKLEETVTLHNWITVTINLNTVICQLQHICGYESLHPTHIT